MPILILFFAFFLAGASASVIMAKLDLSEEYFWLEAISSASAQTFISLCLLGLLLKFIRSLRPSKKTQEWYLLQFSLSAFGIEILLTLSQALINTEQFSALSLLLVKAFLFAFLCSTATFIYIVKPNANKFTSALNLTQFRYATSYIFSSVLLFTFLANVYEQQTKYNVERLIQSESEQLTLIDKALTYRVSEAVLDTVALASQPDFTRHLKGYQNSLKDLKLEFQNTARIKKSYNQIRFIDSSGQESIRVNQLDSIVEIVSKHKLQNKRDRYYVPETGKLDHGKVYISPLDLNVEHGKIEIPYKPIARISTPVKDTYGEFLGLIVINLNASHLIQHLQDAQKLSQGSIMLLNSDGYWLHAEDEEKRWGFMFDKKSKTRIQTQMPELWNSITDKTHGSIKTENGYFIFHKVKLSQSPRIQRYEQTPLSWPEWTLITQVSPETINQQHTQRFKFFVSFYLLFAAATAIGTYLYTLSQLKRNHAEHKVKYMAEHDPLTGLYNRRTLMQQLDASLEQARYSHEKLAIFYLDLDNFKPINDRFGHEAGDQALKHVSQRLSQMLRANDMLARIGGDEFVLLLHNPESKQHLEDIAQRIINKLNEPIHIGNQQYHLGASIGVVITRDHDESRDDLLKAADLLMLEAKDRGKNCYQLSHM